MCGLQEGVRFSRQRGSGSSWDSLTGVNPERCSAARRKSTRAGCSVAAPGTTGGATSSYRNRAWAFARQHAVGCLSSDEQPRNGDAMTARTTPPFRADHVGSFLRPELSAGGARTVLREEEHQRRAAARVKTRRSPRSSSSSRTWACSPSPTASSAAPISTSISSSSWRREDRHSRHGEEARRQTSKNWRRR